MTLRRVIALFVLAAAGWLWSAGEGQFSGTFLSPLARLMSPLIGFFALAVLLFNLPILGPRYEESGFGMLSERQGNKAGAVVLFLFGAALLFIALRGLYNGRMPAVMSDGDFVFSLAPAKFVLAFLAWAAGGSGLVWLGSRIWRQ